MEKNSRVSHAQVWALPGWVTSWEERHQGVEDLELSMLKLGHGRVG